MKTIGIIFSLFFLIPATVSAFVFSQNLTLGSEGLEVLELQRLLNKNVDITVARIGPGSSGQETQRFGTLTKLAVIKFQNKYRSEILEPAGLSSATGFVGALTRKKLNALVQISPSKPLPASSIPKETAVASSEYLVAPNEVIDIYQTDRKITDFQNSIVSEVNKALEEHRVPVLPLQNGSMPTFGSVFISQISSHQTKPGISVTITGGGFSARNLIYFGDTYILRSITSNGAEMSFLVPNIPPGRYDIVVKSATGISNSFFFIIESEKKSRVVITSISPSTLSFGSMVTITGSGFTLQGNEIITTFATIKDVISPDGKTLSFVFAPESFRWTISSGNQHQSIPVSIGIVNDNGFFDYPTTSLFTY